MSITISIKGKHNNPNAPERNQAVVELQRSFASGDWERYVSITDNQLHRTKYANYFCTWCFQPEVQQS